MPCTHEISQKSSVSLEEIEKIYRVTPPPHLCFGVTLRHGAIIRGFHQPRATGGSSKPVGVVLLLRSSTYGETMAAACMLHSFCGAARRARRCGVPCLAAFAPAFLLRSPPSRSSARQRPAADAANVLGGKQTRPRHASLIAASRNLERFALRRERLGRVSFAF